MDNNTINMSVTFYTDAFVELMKNLRKCNDNVASIFHTAHGVNIDMEEAPEYIAVQTTIVSAIDQLGVLLGKSIAESVIYD